MMREKLEGLTPSVHFLVSANEIPGLLPAVAIPEDGNFDHLVGQTWKTTWTGVSFHLFLDLQFPDLGLAYRFFLDLVKDDDAEWAKQFCLSSLGNGVTEVGQADGTFCLTVIERLIQPTPPLLPIQAETRTPGFFLAGREMALDKSVLRRFCKLHEGAVGRIKVTTEVEEG
jgi:hypothetical protein